MNVLFKILLCLTVYCRAPTVSLPLSDVNNAVETARIVNGYEVNIADVPYQASLQRRVSVGWSHMCGAVVISERGVLTAAHCIDAYSSTPSSLRVKVGTSYRVSGGSAYDISSVIPHEDYNSSTLENDIGLLVTEKLIEFGKYVQPVAVANKQFNIPTGTKAIVSGFGTTSYEGTASNVLLAADVTVVDHATCVRAYLRIADITKGMLCASATSPPRDACQGDSGGPLVADNNLIGLVSWGEGCADTSYPGVYTKVTGYYEWIWKKLK